MPSFKYIIELSDTDRAILNDIVSKGTSSAKTILRANILLASDKNGKRYMTVAEIAEVYHTTPTTVQNVRTSYCEKGLDATISRKKRETVLIQSQKQDVLLFLFFRKLTPLHQTYTILCKAR